MAEYAQVGKSALFQAQFPDYQTGRESEVYYTVYNSDGTVFIARTNSGVKEYGNGSYGVNLTFTQKNSYSIAWDLNNEMYTGEEINVLDFNELENIYRGYAS